MKKRQVISTFEAQELQNQINHCKHERARKLLESRLRKTYMESFVDLDKKEATVLCMENHLSDKSKEHLQYDIIDYIIREYQIDISNIKVYTQAVFSAALESGTPFPKSSIIKPEIVGDSDEMPITLVNDRPEAQSNPDIRERVDSFLDLKDNTLQKLGFEVISESGYIEAGNIVIVVETK